ncbi:TIR domain-containing protein [Vibrio cholerae]|uniref:toll/interleukin-1 receptor domain-containing protein n=1 Tax=Vibrio cholerae TaxID=666 RepID=UPI0029350254|nr:toll/interleukin-1 receptor domain-containing protein [Vibrio cholerae]MDV2398069.1 toll/interleukin-1 receptor domain-containing protein [Vibrio cholerae]
MNVFVSWSGDRSKAVAELLDEWLQCVIQAVDPWMSSKDIDRGSLWFSEINDQLQSTTIGIICLTQENKNKPWILFEAGALAKGLSNNRVCTFLIDLEPTDVGTPLSQFNHTFPTMEGLWELVRTLNNSLKDRALKEKTLEQVFNTYWPQFESSFKKILDQTPLAGEVEKRSDDDILLEILSTTRSMDRRVRALERDKINFNTTSKFGQLRFRNKDGRIHTVDIENLKSLVKEHHLEGASIESIKELLRNEYNLPAYAINSAIADLFDSDD